MHRSSCRRRVPALSRAGVGRAVAVILLLSSPLAFFITLAPGRALACACGCGVFDVGTSSMLPTDAGGTVYLEYDYQDQTIDWSGTSKAPASANGDKDIRTNFLTAGLQYMFNRSWGVNVEVPYWDRKFTTDTNYPTPPPDLQTAQWSQFGDIRIMGIYTGFSDDMSSGLTFGLKLPTGNFQYDSAVVDRDSQIGTGSTDILFGGFQRGALTSDNMWSWFAQALLDQPVFTNEEYRPGTEIDSALGAHYNGWTFGDLAITPLAQIIASVRTRDSGAASADPPASGYERVMLSPGVEFDVGNVSAYADLEFPVFQWFRGDQLTAPWLLKFIAAYHF